MLYGKYGVSLVGASLSLLLLNEDSSSLFGVLLIDAWETSLLLDYFSLMRVMHYWHYHLVVAL